MPEPSPEALAAGGRVLREMAHDVVDGWPFADADSALQVWNAIVEAQSSGSTCPACGSPPCNADSISGSSDGSAGGSTFIDISSP